MKNMARPFLKFARSPFNAKIFFFRYERGLVASNTQLDFVNGVPKISGLVMTSENNEFVLDRVPVVTPNGDVIVPNLSLSFFPGSITR